MQMKNTKELTMDSIDIPKRELFMRAYWGEFDEGHRITKRKDRVDRNIKEALTNKWEPDFITYVFGKENYEYLCSKGLKCVKLCDEPVMFDAIEAQYRHKLEALRYAMEEDGVEEMVHFDWDCNPVREIDADFWPRLREKGPFQANLLQYHRRKATWRGDTDARKIPNGGFIYMNDQTAPASLIRIWETMKGPSAEPPMAKYVDELMGGWQGKEAYWDTYEPSVVNLHRSSVYTKEECKAKNVYFIHRQGGN
jgi:hypothetical protein